MDNLAKFHKIKHYQKPNPGTWKAGPHPLKVILIIALVAGLVFVGVSIYEPVYTFIMNFGKSEGTPSDAPSEPSVPGASDPSSEAAPDNSGTEQPGLSAGDIRAVWLPHETASTPALLDSFLNSLSDTDINAVMFDIKNTQGQLMYRSQIARAASWEAVASNAPDLKALADTLSEKGFRLVVRMATFSDPVAARGDRTNIAVKYQNSEMLWLDNFADRGGKPWANPWSAEMRSYLTEIAVEAAELGAVMVVLDGMQFPDDSTGTAFYGPSAQGNRADALSALTGAMKEALAPFGARCAVYVTATAIDAPLNRSRYGGTPLAVAGDTAVIGILPAQLESGVLADGVPVTRPSQNPAATVREVLDFAENRSGTTAQTKIVLLDSALSQDSLSAQLDAARAAGCPEYILYSPSGAYNPPKR